MTTRINKTVKRLSDEAVFDRRKMRRIVVAIHPGGYIGFRLEGTRKEYTLPIHRAFKMSVQAEIAFAKAEKERIRREKKGGKYLVKRK